jgi:ribosomal protein L13E
MEDYEKKGAFYLGKLIGSQTGKIKENEPFLYDAKNFTTHAVCLGMTGSGKTGLGISILEEAGLEGIPAIIIDPKGDVANLVLTFPQLSAEEFLPWIDEIEAKQKGEDPQAYAIEIANIWKEGLARWGEGTNQIQKLKNSVEMVIYTPANQAGVPLSILSSFEAPSKDLIEDAGAFRDRVMSITSSLLGLLGIHTDPIKSREHILISTLIDQAWRAGDNLSIARLIQLIQKPPFTTIGALDVDTFFSPKERMALSISLNNLLASPGFQAWMEGEPLNINQLLYTKEGKPKFSILSIAHLSDAERIFFVTLLLNEILSWMRQQSGTSSLRALLYMDEIFGYFPPTAMPSTKIPMLTLLKQARAYGLGIVLVTQNPVDLDYKGLANCGTWFIGKLQTERDKARVCEGLKIASNGEIGENELNSLLAKVGNRTFIVRSIYEKEPLLFTTRWALSYLRGPLTLTLIKNFTKSLSLPTSFKHSGGKKALAFMHKPLIPPEVDEIFLNHTLSLENIHYKPQILGISKVHFLDTKYKIDVWKELCILAPSSGEGKEVLWAKGKDISANKQEFEKTALPGSQFTEIPAGLLKIKNYLDFKKEFSSFLYQNQTIELFQFQELDLISKEAESREDFTKRVEESQNKKLEQMIHLLRGKYEEKISAVQMKLQAAQEKANRQQQKVGWQKFEAYLSFGATILGTLFGRGVTKGTINQAGTSLKRAGKIGMDHQSATQAEETYEAYQKQLQELQLEMQKEIAALISKKNMSPLQIDTIAIKPRKSDISIEKIALVWEICS